MALSLRERDALAGLVEQKLSGRRYSREHIRAVVEQVCSALGSSGKPATGEDVVIVLSAASTPDLGSRLRQALTEHDIVPGGAALASSGRHTVAALQLKACDVAACLGLARSLGCHRATPLAMSELAT